MLGEDSDTVDMLSLFLDTDNVFSRDFDLGFSEQRSFVEH